MRKTYAYNSIIFGVLLGILVYATTESIALTILTGLGVSVVGFFIIRMIENAIHKGVHKAADKISDAYQHRKEQKAIENGTYVKPETTQMPQRTTTQMPQRTTTQMPARPAAEAVPAAQPTVRPAVQPAAEAVPAAQPTATITNFCPYCGKKIDGISRYCPYCGESID